MAHRTVARGSAGVVAALAALALWAPAVGGAEEAPQDPGSPEASAMLHGRLQLSLDEAIAMALKNNLDVEVSRHDPLIAWEEFRAAWGAYDPEFFGEFDFQSIETPVASVLQASTNVVSRDSGGEGGLRGKVPWLNATYQLRYDANRNTTTSSIQSLSPQFTVFTEASVTVPLLRDLIWDQDWTRVKQSRIVHGQNVEEFRRQVMDTASAVETSYWDLVGAEEQLRVAEKSVETAKALLEQTEVQYEVGVVSRVEVTEAEAGLAAREAELIRVRNAYRNAQDVLMDEVLGRGLRPGSELQVVPNDRPGDYILYEIDVERATEKAFSNRPELASARREIERRRLETKFRRNQRLPQLDVRAFYRLDGLSGETNPAPSFITDAEGNPIPRQEIPIPSEFVDAHDTFFSGSDQSESSGVGVSLSIPLFNQRARHQATAAEIDLRKSRSEVVRLRQEIVVGVRRAARDLESNQERIAAAERALAAAREQLRAERIRLEQGESTPFDVLLREEALVESESEKIDAIRSYRNSRVALERQQGTILKSRNIRIDDFRGIRAP